MKIKPITIAENKPYPNNSLPAILYSGALTDAFLNDSYSDQDVLDLFENNGYTNGWVAGIKKEHHFHSNAHEVLACTKGEAKVQFGGPGADIHTIRKDDVVLLPAGTAHKKLDSSQDFTIVGAYPDGKDFDMQYGQASDYEAIVENVQNVALPASDPVTGSPGAVDEYWK